MSAILPSHPAGFKGSVFVSAIRKTVDEKSFGHSFQVDVHALDIKACRLEWWEYTDKPYVETMDALKWNDMYTLCPKSEVFLRFNIATTRGVGGDRKTALVDPPGIFHTDDKGAAQTNERTLYIVPVVYFDDHTAVYAAIKQHLKCEVEGKKSRIISQELSAYIQNAQLARNPQLVIPSGGAPDMGTDTHAMLKGILS